MISRVDTIVQNLLCLESHDLVQRVWSVENCMNMTNLGYNSIWDVPPEHPGNG